MGETQRQVEPVTQAREKNAIKRFPLFTRIAQSLLLLGVLVGGVALAVIYSNALQKFCLYQGWWFYDQHVMVLLWIGFCLCGVGLILFRHQHSRKEVEGRFPRVLAWMSGAVVLLFVLTILINPRIKDEVIFQSPCINNQRQLANAILFYAQDHHDRMPGGFDDIRAYLDHPLHALACPDVREWAGIKWGYRYDSGKGYGYNAALVGSDYMKIENPADVLMTADSIQPGMLLHSETDIAIRHGNSYVASFADGHVEFVLKPRYSPIRWK